MDNTTESSVSDTASSEAATAEGAKGWGRWPRPSHHASRRPADRVRRGRVVAQHHGCSTRTDPRMSSISSQRKEVRDYIADQATLRLAGHRTSCRRRARSSPTPSHKRSPPRRSRKRCTTSRCGRTSRSSGFTEERRVSVSSAQAAITDAHRAREHQPEPRAQGAHQRPERDDDDLAVAGRRHARRCRQVDRPPVHPDVPDRARADRARDLEVEGSRARHPGLRHPAGGGRCAPVRHRRGDAGVCRSGRHQRPGAGRGGRPVHRRARRPTRRGRQGHDRDRPRPRPRTRSRRRRPEAPLDAGPGMGRAASLARGGASPAGSASRCSPCSS